MRCQSCSAAASLRPSFSPPSSLALSPPNQVVVRGKAGKSGVKGITAALTLTREFEL
jgi:hypothetical protein